MPHAPGPASCFLPRAHFIPGLAFSELVLGFGSQDSPLHQCPRCLVSPCQRPKTSTRTSGPPARPGWECAAWIRSPGAKACLKTWSKSQDKKDENPTKKHPPQGMRVWVPSLWWFLAGAPQWRGKDRTGTILLPHGKSQALCWGLLVLRFIVSMLAFVRLSLYFHYVPNKGEPFYMLESSPFCPSRFSLPSTLAPTQKPDIFQPQPNGSW